LISEFPNATISRVFLHFEIKKWSRQAFTVAWHPSETRSCSSPEEVLWYTDKRFWLDPLQIVEPEDTTAPECSLALPQILSINLSL
jgi:hypothetical protein